jgi:hypothetical protein
MAKVKLELGATLDLLSKDELDESLGHRINQWEMMRARGDKYMRLPKVTGTAAGGVLNIGGDVQPFTGLAAPRPGYAWVIKRLSVSGLTPAGETTKTSTNVTTAPPAFTTLANVTGLPAATYQVTASAYFTGTVTAADANNVQLWLNGTNQGTLLIPPVANGAPVPFTATIIAPANSIISLVTPAAGSVAATYNTQLEVTGGSATGDVVNLYKRGGGTDAVWQFTGSSPNQTFNKGGMVVLDGEALVLASTGDFTATGPIVLSGELVEVPQLELWKAIV